MKRDYCKKLLLRCFAVFLITFPVKSSGDEPNYPSMVYPSADGALEYVSDYLGNTIPDYSHAGYMGGGVSLPHVPVRETVMPVKGDASPAIQAAIDKVSALTPDKNGFRGAVLIKRGYYDLYSTLTIAAGGVVLRGEGASETGTVLIARKTKEMIENPRSYLNTTFLIAVDSGSGI